MTTNRSKKVVFTVLFGDYETLNEQSCANREEIDFICLTDSSILSSSTWKVIRVATTGLDAVRESRQPKILAHEYLGADYDESLYIDNTVILKKDPADIFLNFLPVGTDLCCFQHPWRNCLYQEAEVIKAERIDDVDRVNKQINYYRQMGYPTNNGLIAGTFLLRRHNSESVVKTMEFWFEQVLRYSKRDQLSFNFSAWVCKFKFVTINLNLTNNLLMQWPVYNNRRTMKAQVVPSENAASFLDYKKIPPIHINKDTKLQKEHFIWHSLGGDTGKREEFYIDNPRSEIVAQFEHKPHRVLEIGCATGATGKLIKEIFPDAWVAGIELSETAAKIASSRLDLVINQKFEESNPESYGIAKGSIDTVILADVLEHMYDPWHVLVRLRPYLTPNAQVFASIPNVRNLWLMNELAHGRFTYETMGLLDITHIRFFTRAEINKLFQETGYQVMKVHYNLDSRLTHIKYQSDTYSIETDKLVLKNVTPEELLDIKTLQFVVLARPADDLEKNNTTNYPVSAWLATHIWEREQCHRLLDSCKATEPLQLIHLLLIIPTQKNLPANSNENKVDQLSSSANHSQIKLIKDILNDLNEQPLTNWCLTIFSEYACPENLRLKSRTELEWVQTPYQQQSEAITELVKSSSAEWFFYAPPGLRLSPAFTLLAGSRLHERPNTLLLYTDEDTINTDGEHAQPKLKPDINLELLRSSPYVGAATLIHKSLMLDPRIAILPPGLSRNYGAALLAVEQGPNAIEHLDEILVHVPESLADEYAATPLANLLVQQHLTRCGVAAEVRDGPLPGALFIDYLLPDQPPKVSIIIAPTPGRLSNTRACLESLIANTNYPDFEILVIDQGIDSGLPIFLAEAASRFPQIQTLRCPQKQSWLASYNVAARQAQGAFLLFLNDDCIVLQENWLTRLAAIGIRAEVGVAGCRLVSLDHKIRHAGLILGHGGTVDHIGIDSPLVEPGYMGRAQLAQNFSAVSGDCMLVRKELFLEMGGFDEKDFPNLYHDADFCLKVGERGYQIVWTPFVTLAQQNKDDLEEKQKAQKEQQDSRSRKAFIKKWRSRLGNDPTYNRHLSLRQREWMIDGDFDVPWHPDLEPLPRIVAQPPDEMGVGQYRMIGPLKELTDSGRICSFLLPALTSDKRFLPYVSELLRAKPTVFFLQNAFSDFHLDDLQHYAELLPDLFRVFGQDDIVFSIPQKSAARKHFGKDTKARVRKAASLCHRAIVTTEPIAEAMRGMVDDIRVMPNTLERSRWGDLQPPRNERRKPRVGWAGAQQHQGDLEFILPVVEATANEVDWIFMGMCPPKLRYHVAEAHNAVPFDQYPTVLAALDLDLAIAPLELNRFNTAKSNLRLLEYGAVGYPVIATDILPYRNAPVTRVPNNPKAWIDAIRAHVRDPDATHAAGDQLREWVLSHWMLDQYLDEWLKALLPD